MQHKPGKTDVQLAAWIQQDVTKYNFDTVKDPHSEAMQTHFICSIGNETVFKASFKVSDEELISSLVTSASHAPDAQISV